MRLVGQAQAFGHHNYQYPSLKAKRKLEKPMEGKTRVPYIYLTVTNEDY